MSAIPLHCWNYDTFKRIAEVWGNLVFVGGNVTKIVSYENVELLISITQPKLINEVIGLKVGDDQFWIRVKKKGLSETGGGGISINM